MTRKLALLLVVTALTWSGSASADGMNAAPVAAAATGCGTGPFNGFYVGAGLGYGRHDADIKDEIYGGSYGDDDSSFTGGAFWGYNYQCGRWLIGYESDINFLNTSAEDHVDTISLKSDIDWFGTSRIRLGLVSNERVLFYATGGLAYASVDHRFSDSFFSFSRSDDDNQFGWTIGGGVEFIHAGNWTVRAEGLWVDLGSETENYKVSSDSAYGCSQVCRATAKWEDDFWVARVGIAYKFGAREEVVPLK